jgi:hypothetical protein
VRVLIALAMVLSVGACGAERKWAPDEAVEQARYVHEGPSTITLFTVLKNSSGSGAHASLMINGSQRVIFDPAGTWYHPNLPERNDVHYGITNKAVDFYIDYHARETYRVVRQEVVVSPEVAEAALRAAEAYGAVPKANCTIAVTKVLQGLPGFEAVGTTYFPKAAMEDFGRLAGVTTEVIYDNDPEENGYLLVAADLRDVTTTASAE